MKFRITGRSLATSIISLSAALALTSCGSDFTVGFLFLPLAQINSSGGGGVNVFKVEHNFGKLTLMNKTPVSSGGGNAVQAIVVGNGRFLYVVNQAAPQSADSAVVLFSIGGRGVLAQQQGYATQGTSPIALTSDSNSSHLYVVDQIAPAGAICPTGKQPNNPTAATSLCGDITAYNIDSTTGRLSLIQNQNSTDSQGTQLTYFPVGKNPIKVVASGGFLFVLDQGDSTVFPYQIGADGQLTLTQNGPLQTGGLMLTAITSGGKSGLYITDAGTNQILPYTIGAGGSLALQNGGPVANQATGSPFPDAILVDTTGKFLYVANRGANPNTNNPNSSISAFTIDQSNGKLQPISGGPYPADSGANCLVEDPSNQYIYASAFDNSSVKGSLIRSTGELQPLKKGSTFALTGNPNCVVASGRVN
jgi:6-phosphogluconolactonase (cycloisomerase 2 family)